MTGVSTYSIFSNGMIQWLRTGAFYQWNAIYRKHFKVDRALIDKILFNTKLVGRALRINYMHWPIVGDGPQESPDDYERAGQVDPRSMYVQEYTDPRTMERLIGIFSTVAWDTPARNRVQNKTLTEFSPEICWEYKTSQEILYTDAAGKKIRIPAGTMIGPVFTGGALVDKGFFEMAEVQAFRMMPYKGSKYNMLTAAQMQELIAALMDLGWPEDLVNKVIKCIMSSEAIGDQATPAPLPDVDPAAAMVARVKQMRALAAFVDGSGKNSTSTTSAQKKATPVTPVDPFERMLELFKQHASTTTPAQQPEEDRLARLERMMNSMLFKQAESQGMHNGIPTKVAQHLFTNNPDLYAEMVGELAAQKANNRSPQAPGAGTNDTLARIATDAEMTKDQQIITAYKQEQAKLGKVLTTMQAIQALQGLGKLK